MKIKDVISEGPFEFLQKLKAARASSQLSQSNREKTASAAAQAQQKAPEPQAQEPQQPNPDMAEKNAWLNHIMQGMRRFEVALAQDPNLAQA
jgi:hypothetical protein